MLSPDLGLPDMPSSRPSLPHSKRCALSTLDKEKTSSDRHTLGSTDPSFIPKWQILSLIGSYQTPFSYTNECYKASYKSQKCTLLSLSSNLQSLLLSDETQIKTLEHLNYFGQMPWSLQRAMNTEEKL